MSDPMVSIRPSECIKLVPTAAVPLRRRPAEVVGIQRRTDSPHRPLVSRKMYGPLQQRMAHVLEQMGSQRDLSERSRRSLQRLGEFNWSADIAALAALVTESPGLVEEYLNLMACSLHEFPSPAVTP